MNYLIKREQNKQACFDEREERPHLAFDHYDIMQDAIQKYKEIVK